MEVLIALGKLLLSFGSGLIGGLILVLAAGSFSYGIKLLFFTDPDVYEARRKQAKAEIRSELETYDTFKSLGWIEQEPTWLGKKYLQFLRRLSKK